MGDQKELRRTIFPKYKTIGVIGISAFLILSLILGLNRSQRDLIEVSQKMIPAGESASIAMRILTERENIYKNNLQVKEYPRLLRNRHTFSYHYNFLKNTSDGIIFNQLELIVAELQKAEEANENKAKILILISQAREMLVEFTDSILEEREARVNKRILVNNYLRGTTALAAIILSLLLFLLIKTLRLNINSKNSFLKILLDREFQVRTLLRVLSHDISTPLSTVIVKSQLRLRKQNELMDKDLDNYTKILAASKDIKDIIDHVREMEAIESGKKSVTLNSVDLLEVLSKVCDSHEEKLTKKNIKIDIEAQDDTYNVMAEPVSIRGQVFGNLISNAIKFSHTNSTISIQVSSFDTKTKVIIKDNGVGIPEELIDKLFDPSAHTSRVGTDGEKGTGFGMPLVKAYMEKFNGSIDVISTTLEESSGTQFVLIFNSAN